MLGPYSASKVLKRQAIQGKHSNQEKEKLLCNHFSTRLWKITIDWSKNVKLTWDVVPKIILKIKACLVVVKNIIE